MPGLALPQGAQQPPDGGVGRPGSSLPPLHRLPGQVELTFPRELGLPREFWLLPRELWLLPWELRLLPRELRLLPRELWVLPRVLRVLPRELWMVSRELRIP